MATLMVVPSWFGNDPTAIRLLTKQAKKYNEKSKDLFAPHPACFMSTWVVFLMLEDIKTKAGEYVNRTRADYIAMKDKLMRHTADAVHVNDEPWAINEGQKRPYSMPLESEILDVEICTLPVETLSQLPLDCIYESASNLGLTFPRTPGKGQNTPCSISYWKHFITLLKEGMGLIVLDADNKTVQMLAAKGRSYYYALGKRTTKIITSGDLSNMHPNDVTYFKKQSLELLQSMN